MAIAIANVSYTSTFGGWLDRTNQIAAVISTSVVTIGSNNTGNTAINGIFSANTVATPSLRGGTIAASGPLSITSNTNFTGQTVSIGSNTTISGNTLTVTSISNFSKSVEVANNVVILGRNTFKSSREGRQTVNIAAGVLTIDFNSNANIFDIPLNQNITSIVFNNVPDSNEDAAAILLRFAIQGAYSIDWPSICKHVQGNAPAISEDVGDVCSFTLIPDSSSRISTYYSGPTK